MAFAAAPPGSICETVTALENSLSLSQRFLATTCDSMLASTLRPPPKPMRPRKSAERKSSSRFGRRRPEAGMGTGAAARRASPAWLSIARQYRRGRRMPRIEKGMKVVHRAQPGWGIGHVVAVSEDPPRLAVELGALFASRVYVKPHQVSVAHHVLSAPQPRFVLADEVGLGKTIEAGLVLAALLHAGLMKRALVVAPSHLTVQWLAELFHKFNLLFTLMDPERAAEARKAEAEESPSVWGQHALVVTSLEWLSRAKDEAREAAEVGWDLVIIDEAHHLRGPRAYEVAQSLAASTWGLLLLTATPLQLDPGEYHALLRLVDPAPAATEEELRARLVRQGDLAAEVRALLAGDAAAAKRIA